MVRFSLSFIVLTVKVRIVRTTAAADLRVLIFPGWIPTAGASSEPTPLPEDTTDSGVYDPSSLHRCF